MDSSQGFDAARAQVRAILRAVATMPKRRKLIRPARRNEDPMREIVLDTETTGLDPYQGHRLVEIGCIELRQPLPDRADASTAISIPNATCRPRRSRCTASRPTSSRTSRCFAEIADELLAFIGDAPLVAHNAHVRSRLPQCRARARGKTLVARERLVDTLMLARRKHPGGPNRLDDLCARYGIDNSRRTKHGALLDAELLAEVYVELIGARQAPLSLVDSRHAASAAGATRSSRVRVRPQPLAPRLTDERARGASRLHRDARREARSGATICRRRGHADAAPRSAR